MTKRDVVDDLVDLVHPQLGPWTAAAPGDDPDTEIDQDAHEAVRDDIDRARRDFEENLRAAQEVDPIVWSPDDLTSQSFDPLIDEICRARRDLQEAEGRLRLLLAYAREFTVRAYPLADLARASGMSQSGVRTAYTPTEIAEVTSRVRRNPRDIIGLRGDTGRDECAVISGKRNQAAANCVGEPTTIGGAPRTDQLFHVCAAHAYLVSNPRPMTDVAVGDPESALS